MEPFDLDLLKEGSWSDVLWSMKRYAPQSYKFSVTRTPQEIKCDVLNSRRVQHVIEKVTVVSVIICILLFDLEWPGVARGVFISLTKQLCFRNQESVHRDQIWLAGMANQ